MRLSIVGGGGFRVPLVYRELVRRPDHGVTELVLHDSSAGRLQVIRRLTPPTGALRVRTTTDLTEAITGADVVFSAIRVGGAAGRVADERRALRHGLIGQETVGAGGLCYGLRTLPVALALAEGLADRAPGAWLINFTNPAGLVTEASRQVLGERVIGICDSPAALIGHASRAVGGAEPVIADYAGINHLGWLRALWQGGVDRLPELLADPVRLAGFEEGRLFGPALLRSLAAIPNEYLYFYYHRDEVLAQLRAGPTRGEVVAAEQEAFFAAAAAEPERTEQLWQQTRLRREQSYLAEARDFERDPLDLAGGGYERIALALLHGLTGGQVEPLVLNVANGATFAQLPPDLVVETRCQVTAQGAAALPAQPFSLHQLGLISSVRAAERGLIEATRSGRKEPAVAALTAHPLIGDERLARAVITDLLTETPGLALR